MLDLIIIRTGVEAASGATGTGDTMAELLFELHFYQSVGISTMALLTQLSQHIYTCMAWASVYTYCPPSVPWLTLQDPCGYLEVWRPAVHVVFIPVPSALLFPLVLIRTSWPFPHSCYCVVFQFVI